MIIEKAVRPSALMQVVAEDNDSKHTRSGLTSHVYAAKPTPPFWASALSWFSIYLS